MVFRAARLAGMNTEGRGEALLSFRDGAGVSAWAREAVAFCAENEIFFSEETVLPQTPILREEIAEMIYRMLLGAKLFR